MGATAPRSRRQRRSGERRSAAVPQQRRPHELERFTVPAAAPPARAGAGGSWAWGLIAATLPTALVLLLVVTGMIELAGARPGTAAGAVGVALYLAVAVPLVAAAVVGMRAWNRQRDLVGLRAALFSAWALIVGTAAVLVA